MSRDLLFEIGAEELPAGYIPPALQQLERGARAGLAELRLEFADVRTAATPRRLTLMVDGVDDRQTDFDEEAVGPATRVAYDADGQPTKALLGFCRGKNVEPADVRRIETPKGEYVAVTVHHVGKPAAEVLPELLARLATSLTFPKSMRWAVGSDVRFARPVRWLVALLRDEVLPVQAFGLTAGRTTRGHRFLSPQPIALRHTGEYLEALEQACVLVDPAARSARLMEQVQSLAAEAGGRVVADDELLEINNYLLEWPTAFAGKFEDRFLDLPRDVTVTALREHQRFFAVERPDGRLLPAFVAARNGDERGLSQVRRGNQDVLTARLEDARFYWETDRKLSPADRMEALAGVVWMEGLGTLRDKATRLESLAGWLASRLAPSAADTARRAALLCKTDLLTEMIGSGKEYASLEGIIGGYYARAAGEPAAVADAIAEHYRPRGAGDRVPETEAGAILAIADKLDHVAGAFVADKAPSGSEDPYGVRRAANGVVRILIERQAHLDLRDATMEATSRFFASAPELPQAVIMKKLGEFWRGRIEAALEERGVAYDAREAALDAQIRLDGSAAGRPGWIDPFDCLRRAQVLAAFRGDRRFEPLVVLFKRVANILKASTEPLPASLDRVRLVEPPEQALAVALDDARTRTVPLWERRDYDAILPALLELESPIHSFFEKVLVNAEDVPTRQNRLRLLSEVRDLFVRGWDLSKAVVEGEKA